MWKRTQRNRIEFLGKAERFCIFFELLLLQLVKIINLFAFIYFKDLFFFEMLSYREREKPKYRVLFFIVHSSERRRGQSGASPEWGAS